MFGIEDLELSNRILYKDIGNILRHVGEEPYGYFYLSSKFTSNPFTKLGLGLRVILWYSDLQNVCMYIMSMLFFSKQMRSTSNYNAREMLCS